MVIYTCPKCGSDLHHQVICTLPPIDVVRCYSCGYYHEERQHEAIERITYDEGQESNNIESLKHL